jgi:hypothetical protein
MCSWTHGFATAPMIKSILAEGLDVIDMVKQLNQRYNNKGNAYTLPQLQKFVSFDGAQNIFGSLRVTTSCKNYICTKSYAYIETVGTSNVFQGI